MSLLDIVARRESFLLAATILGIVVLAMWASGRLAGFLQQQRGAPFAQMIGTALNHLDYRYRKCDTLRAVTDRIVAMCRAGADREIKCASVAAFLNVPRFIARNTAISQLLGSVEFGEKVTDVVKAIAAENCVGGRIRLGVLADAIEREIGRACASDYIVANYESRDD